MRIITLNCNGLRSAERHGFSAWLADARPDILLLQEVRADASSLDAALLSPPGWRVGWHFAEKKGYAGTAVWVKEGLEGMASIAFSVGTGHPRGDGEGRVIGAQLRWHDGRTLDAWSVYLPSGSSGPERQEWKFAYLDHFGPWMTERLRCGRPTIIGGDWNIAHTPKDIKNAKSNEKNSGFLPEERAWISARLAEGWRDVFRDLHPESTAYSWWSNRGNARANDVGWRIDYVLATPDLPVANAVIERAANLSDHAPVRVEVEIR